MSNSDKFQGSFQSGVVGNSMDAPLPVLIYWPEKTDESLCACLERCGIDIDKFGRLDANTVLLTPMRWQGESHLLISLHPMFTCLYADQLLTPEILNACKDPGLLCSTSLSKIKYRITLNMLCELFEIYNRQKARIADQEGLS